MKVNLNILLIDDSEAVNFVHAKLFRNLCVSGSIEVKENGQEAIDYLEKSIEQGSFPDLIFLDINMPVMDGWQFLDSFEMKFKNDHKKVILFMVTTSQNPDDKSRSTHYDSVTGFMIKPLRKKNILEVLDTYFTFSEP